jgi:hypothetical protein
MVWVIETPSANDFLTSTTLGNLTASKIRIVSENVTWDLSAKTGFLWSQAGTNASTREFGLYSSATDGKLGLYAGGSDNPSLSNLLLLDNVTVDLTVDYVANTAILIIDSVTEFSGSIGAGTSRVAGQLFRFFARNGGYNVPTGTRCGDTSVYINDVLVRFYDVTASDHSGSTNQPIITESVGGNNATGVNFPSFDASVWIDLGGGGVSISALLNSNYMVEYSMKKNVASQSIGAQMITISDGSDFTGTVTVEVTIDNGTKTAGGGTVTHEGEGYHSYAPTQAETNGDHVAFSFAGAGALTQTIQVYTNFPQSTDHTTPLATIDFTVSSILLDTDDLQKNQGDWLTATGFATSAEIADVPTVAEFNARTLPNADYFVVTDYTVPPTTAQIWAETTRTLTAGTNIVLAKGVGVTGFNDITATDIFTTQMTESYAADGVAPTLAQALFLTQQSLGDFSYSGVTQTVKKLDGSTTAATFTLDSSTDPITSKTRSS